MLHRDHKEFLKSFRNDKLLELCFHHKKDGNVQTRLVGPQDYGPNRRSHDGEQVYWFQDVADGEPPHPFTERASEIISMRSTSDPFFRTHPPKYLAAT